MKYITLQFTLLLGILVLLSCQKDKDPFIYENPYKNLTAEEYLSTYTTPEVMFQYAEVDLTTNEISGILINNNGKVLSYKSEKPLNDLRSIEIRISTILRTLSISNETGESVDISQLVDNYKKTRKVDVNNLSARSKASNIVTYFIAYDLTYDFEGNETCSAMGVSRDKYVQKLLQSNDVINNTLQAKQIVDWMALILDKSNS